MNNDFIPGFIKLKDLPELVEHFQLNIATKM